MITHRGTRYQAFFDEPDTFVVPDEHTMFVGAHVARYRFAATLAAGKRVLDVGCGSGYGTAILAAAGQVVGIDGSRRALASAMSSYGGADARFVRMDARAMGVASRSFDLATCFEVIEHVDAPVADEMVEEISRCLKNDGIACFSTPNHAVVTRSGAAIPEFHINNLNADEFRALLAGHFPRVEMWGQRLAGNTLYRILRTVDAFGVRYSVYNALGRRVQQRAYRAMGVDTAPHHSPDDYEFSRWFVARAGMLFAICGK